MQTSPNGRKFIESWEGIRLTSYADQKGIPTIGVGHTGPDVYMGETITQEDADNLLAVDLHRAETVIYDNVQVPLSQNSFDALVSLIFNIGGHAFENSTVLKRLDAGDFQGAGDAFLMWDKTNGQVNKGLANRRAAERTLFLTPEAS